MPRRPRRAEATRHPFATSRQNGGARLRSHQTRYRLLWFWNFEYCVLRYEHAQALKVADETCATSLGGTLLALREHPLKPIGRILSRHSEKFTLLPTAPLTYM